MSNKGAMPPFEMVFEFHCSAPDTLSLSRSDFLGTEIA